MSILVCAATAFEIAPSIATIGESGGQESDLLITGVGMVATTYALTKAISCKRPQLVIQAGIAGALDQTLQPGKVVVVQKESIGDLGVMEGGYFKNIFALQLLDSNTHPWKEASLANEHNLLQETGLPLVNAVSISEITTDREIIAYYRNALGASIESMEGAALHYVCLMEGIPFIQLRSVSNYVGERDKSKWKIEEAISSLNTELQRLIKQYKSI